MKIDRLFGITNILINKKSVTANELADKFNVSVRTIYRDIDILSSNGIPILTSQGKGGGISIMNNYSIDKTLLSDEEQKQVLMALESVKATGEEGVSDSLIKLGNLFKKNSSSWIEIDYSNWEKNDEENTIFKIIKNSILYKKAISITYVSSKGEKVNRVVEPLKLIFKECTWYLYAYCRLRNDYRFFKLSRIRNLEELDDKFSKCVPEIINKTYEVNNKEIIDLVLIVDSKMAFRVYDELKNGKIYEEDHYYRIEVSVEKGKWLFSYLLSYREYIEVLSPIEVRNEMKDIIKNILKKYSF